jgi:hypothetical protein
MANEKTCSEFHGAKSDFESSMEDFKRAAEADSRDIPEELIEAVFNIFGEKFLEKLNAEISAM